MSASVNPVTWLMDWLVSRGLSGLWMAGETVLRTIVFRPLYWSGAPGAVVLWSSRLAEGALGAGLVVAALSLVWDPLVQVLPRTSGTGVVVRALAAASAMSALPAVTSGLLQLNQEVTASILAHATAPGLVTWSGSLLALSPLLFLAIALLLAGVLVGLSLLYVLRAMNIFWLCCLLPWFLLGWLASGENERLWRPVRELVVLVFQQAAQALAWWLASALLRSAAAPAGFLVGCGALWFLLRVPGELRRLAGLSASAGGVWRW
jgi:hypothetical protein